MLAQLFVLSIWLALATPAHEVRPHAPPADETLEELTDRLMSANALPAGAVTVIRNGRVLIAKGYGTRNREEGYAADADSRFRLSSNTKAFTAMGIMILKERHPKLRAKGFDTPLSAIFERLPAYLGNITLRQLLTHTAGLCERGDLHGFAAASKVNDRWVLSSLKRSKCVNFEPPGTKAQYSNVNYAVLGEVIGELSPGGYRAFMRDNVFKPLGMASTLYWAPGEVVPEGQRWNWAQGYRRKDGAWERSETEWNTGVASRGLWSTANDMAQWDRAWRLSTEPNAGRLVSDSTLRDAFAEVCTAGGDKVPEVDRDNKKKGIGDASYGFGWGVAYSGNYQSHSGATDGFESNIIRTYYRADPKDRITIIVMTNRETDVADAKLKNKLWAGTIASRIAAHINSR